MRNWVRKKIKDFAFTTSGGTPNTSIKEYWENGVIPWINSGELSRNNFIRIPTTYISEKALKNSSAKLMPIGTVVIALTGATTGMTALLEIETSGNQSITGIFPSENHDSLYLLYLLQLNRNSILSFNTGSAQPHINKQIVDDLEFIIPEEKYEQARISKIIRSADEAIYHTEALIAKYNRIKTGLMQDLLTLGIDERGNIRSKATHKFVVKNGIEVPEEWEVKTVGVMTKEKIIDDIQDGNHGEKHPKASDFVEEGVPFIMATDISSGIIDFKGCKKITTSQYKSLRIGFAKSNDILLSHKASLGFVAIVPTSVNELMLTPQVTYYRVINEKRLSYKYLSFYMKGDAFQSSLSNFAKQSTRDYIGITMQKDMKIAYPKSIVEQLKISEVLDESEKEILSKKIIVAKLHALKAGLMSDLLSGKVRVPEGMI